MSKALPNAKLETVKASGHCVDMEQPDALAKLVTNFHRSGVIAMHLMYFTEQPMSAYPEQAGRDFGATALMFPNSNFDPVQGSRLYNKYIEQYMLAEEVGVDGIMLNEHHNAPFCMQAKANVFAAILAGHDQEGEDRDAGQSAAAGGEPDPAGRRARHDRHDLQGPAGLGLRARRRPGAARHRRQSRLQPRALRGSARPGASRPGRSPARSASRARTTSTAW